MHGIRIIREKKMMHWSFIQTYLFVEKYALNTLWFNELGMVCISVIRGKINISLVIYIKYSIFYLI